MKSLMASAVFCEDIREEASGKDILVGTLTDNLAFSGVPARLPKLGVYIRGFVEASSKPEAISAWIQFPWGDKIDLGEANYDLMKAAIIQAKATKNPMAGFIFKAVFSQLMIPSLGVVTAVIKRGKQEQICGMLSLVINPATASPQPSSLAAPAT